MFPEKAQRDHVVRRFEGFSLCIFTLAVQDFEEQSYNNALYTTERKEKIL